MDTIASIEIISFALEVKDFTKNYRDEVLGGSMVYEPGAVFKRPALMLRVRADSGLVGEYAFWSTTGAAEQAVVAARSAVGRRWQERQNIYRTARRSSRPAHSYGLCFLDCALWDLAGKAYNASLTEMLGGHRKEVQAYASSNNGDRKGNMSTKEAVSEFFLSLKQKGFKGFKMHSWHEGDKWEEAANVAHMRKTLGEKAELMLDPACVFDNVSDAIFVGKACEEAGFRWYEDPLRPTGLGVFQHRQLREALDIPILQTEHVAGPEAKADFLLAGGTDLLRADVNYDLGITGCLKTIAFGESLGVNTEIHQPGPVHRHLIASMQNTTFYEVANVSPAMLDPSPAIYTCGYSDHVDSISREGMMFVPAKPGIGVEYDGELIARKTTARIVVEKE